MRNLKLIIKREYLARVRNRTFMVMTFLSPLILVAMIMLIAYLASLNSEEQRIVGINDETGLFAGEFRSSEEIKFIDLSEVNVEEAKDLVKEKEYYGLLHIPEIENNVSPDIQFYAQEAPAFGFLTQIEKIIGGKLTNRQLQARGIDIDLIEESQARVVIQIQNFAGERTSKMSTYVKMFFGGAAGYLLMMFIIIYGNMVMRSVIEEKTNRIIEIIISSVKPIHLMLGKILGTSFAGITQFIIWVILGGIMLTGVSYFAGLDVTQIHSPQQQALEQLSENDLQQLVIDIAKLPMLTLLVSFLVYFIGGYFLYSSIYAAIGAAVDNETDTQQFMFPLILPLMLGIYVGFFSVIENPHGVVSTVFSMIPLTSPIVMLMRIPFGVAWWELALSIALLLLSIAGTVWIAAKIYRVGILMYGKKPGYKELYKWLKY
ncbi:ABC-2 type transport system permease protein [Salinimicrobium catena]|uniref:ABC-2 type transport system permease protein n=1 Tax=Salinimicrobium catena TaxID=390640 RepID=A0A1H5NF11_9FLAO|nr:ABC transporter permease [Salinimicrobium catena]SDL43241.1 ABC-2 type transport system permease protein [Salinimicrobium catena]SEE99437.1 ABC-2 type transport system permease protein [Salinimicrobium catena]